MICISDTRLDFSFSIDDPRFHLPGHNVVRADNPDNYKRGGVLVYFKESRGVRS